MPKSFCVLVALLLASPDDKNWLVHGGAEPKSSIRHSMEKMYAQTGRAGHLDEIKAAALTKPEWEQLASVALNGKATEKADATTGLFEVFSVTRKAWR